MIYLCSTSPRRKWLLKKAGISFRTLKPGYEETDSVKGPPSRVVCVHARQKAASCLGQVRDGILLAADTIVYWDGRIIGKPSTMKRARETLARLQGRWHTVYTGVAILTARQGTVVRREIFFEKSKVRLKQLNRGGIERYFKRVHPLDKAGAYAIQSPHGGIVAEVKGSFSNAVGLPIEAVLCRLGRRR